MKKHLLKICMAVLLGLLAGVTPLQKSYAATTLFCAMADFDNDRDVDLVDYAVLAENWDSSSPACTGDSKTWAQGDITGNGCVNNADLEVFTTLWNRDRYGEPGGTREPCEWNLSEDSCSADSDCEGDGEICTGGVCGCEVTVEDDSGVERCDGTPADDPATDGSGDFCSVDTDCAEGRICVESSEDVGSCEPGDRGDGVYPDDIDPDAVDTLDPYAGGSAGKGGGACSLIASAVPAGNSWLALFGLLAAVLLSLRLVIARERGDRSNLHKK